MLSGFSSEENDERSTTAIATQCFQTDTPAFIELNSAAPRSISGTERKNCFDLFFTKDGDALNVRISILVLEMNRSSESVAVLFVRFGVKADSDFRFLRHAECAGAGECEHGDECADLHSAQLCPANWDLQHGRHTAHIPAYEDALRNCMPYLCYFRSNSARSGSLTTSDSGILGARLVGSEERG